MFIFFEWSAQAHFSKEIVQKWENQFKKFLVFELNPEVLNILSDWVYKEANDLYGFGSLIWMKKGKILNFEKNAGIIGVQGIQEKTVELLS